MPAVLVIPPSLHPGSLLYTLEQIGDEETLTARFSRRMGKSLGNTAKKQDGTT